MFHLPNIYPILDANFLAHSGLPLETFARTLRAQNICFLQYRDKDASDAIVLSRAQQLRQIFPDAILILNDRAHLVRAAGFNGVHLGQQDAFPEATRAQLGSEAILGLSTHSPAQLEAARNQPVDYLAIGPVYTTSSKQNPDPVVGLAGVRQARALTHLPLVAIGGITSANMDEVLAAGADSVALISGLMSALLR